MQEFKFGRTSTNDEPHSGRPSYVTTPEMIRNVVRLVTDDCKLNVREISKMVNISTEHLQNILHNHLYMPHVITDQQKLKRTDVFQYNLDMIKRDPKDFLRRFATVDETWTHHYTP